MMPKYNPIRNATITAADPVITILTILPTVISTRPFDIYNRYPLQINKSYCGV